MPRSGVTPINAGECQIPLLGSGGAGPRVGEVDAAVGFDDDVVRPVEPPALKAVGDDGDAAVELLPGDPPGIVLAGDEPALQVAGQPIGAVGRLLEHRDPFPGWYFMRLSLWMSLNSR